MYSGGFYEGHGGDLIEGVDFNEIKITPIIFLLSPGIYEVGISGFIPLASRLSASRPANCEAPTQSQSERGVRPHDLMALRCLQDPSPPPYPEPSKLIRDRFKQAQSFFWTGPLTITLLILAGFIVWGRIEGPKDDHDARLAWVRGVPMTLFMVATACAFIATRFWHAESLWFTFVLILLGIISSNLTGRSARQLAMAKDSTASMDTGLYDSRAWYIVVPLVMFILALMLAYQMHSTLTDNGLGEPMFLFEGISAWPTVALRLLAVLISLSALTWGWRNLRINRTEIEAAYHLRLHMRKYEMTLWGQVRRLIRRGQGWTLRLRLLRRSNAAGHARHVGLRCGHQRVVCHLAHGGHARSRLIDVVDDELADPFPDFPGDGVLGHGCQPAADAIHPPSQRTSCDLARHLADGAQEDLWHAPAPVHRRVDGFATDRQAHLGRKPSDLCADGGHVDPVRIAQQPVR
ncbi:hypothetical protein [Pseudomonas sp. F01002]|uniref:hypothetical protein n=1 Tax=Pseudomonas sp. F01002 TaxID=2555724 RepID=UPI002113B7D2|nr:hypothetical protein [Pseudomonas sp. F01002]